MNAHNLEQAKQQLAEILVAFDISEEEVLDFAYKLKIVKTHGWGHVQVVVQNGNVQRIEAMIRTLKSVEGQKKG